MQRTVLCLQVLSLPQCCPLRPTSFFFFFFKYNTYGCHPWCGREGSLGREAGMPKVCLKIIIFQLSAGSCPSRDCCASSQALTPLG